MSEEKFILRQENGFTKAEDLVPLFERMGLTTSAKAQKEFQDLATKVSGTSGSVEDALQKVVDFSADSARMLLQAILSLETRLVVLEEKAGLGPVEPGTINVQMEGE